MIAIKDTLGRLHHIEGTAVLTWAEVEDEEGTCVAYQSGDIDEVITAPLPSDDHARAVITWICEQVRFGTDAYVVDVSECPTLRQLEAADVARSLTMASLRGGGLS